MNLGPELQRIHSRRAFLTKSTTGLGVIALASLLNPGTASAAAPSGALQKLHHTPKAKRVSYPFQFGAPPYLALFGPQSRTVALTWAGPVA